MEDDDPFRLSSYIHRTSGFKATTNVEETDDDHTYIRTPNRKPDFVFANPFRTLFVHPPLENISTTKDEDETIDVEVEPTLLSPVYDLIKASNLMDECERHVNFQHPDEGNPDWEDHISKINWTTMQTRLFHRVVRVLHSDRLARLAHQNHGHEPVLRRVTVDKTARRLRQIYASVAWQTKYTQWLHTTLIDNMHASYLVSYLDALQTLKSKVPMLVDRMLAGSTTKSALAAPTHELLNIVHKRPWDPLSVGITHYKPKKLPQDPILVMVPSGPGSINSSNSRTHHWMANLSALGTVVCVYSAPGRVASKTSVTNCLDHMLASTRAKVAELHADYGDKPIILVGIGTGATLACQVAVVENVSAVVCLGFPMYTVEDVRGTPDDSLLNLQVPVLFVVGQNSTTCSVGDLEDMRDKLNVVTSLVVLGGGDDQLRLTKARKKLDKVTQSMVDKCVMDEVADFLGTLLAPDYVPPVKPTIHYPVETPPKRTMVKPVERKRKCDISIPGATVPAPTPAKKGRKPKISMMQKMVQNKWANQMTLPSSEITRSSSVVSTPTQRVTLTMSNTTKPVVLEKKGHQYNTQPSKVPQPGSSEGTITVVAATTPTLSPAGSVKSRLASGQLTSLSSILQPGTRGVLSPSSRKGGENIVTVTSSVVNNPPIIDELNILDMPVILGDQNPDDMLDTATPTLKPKPSPVKLILTNTKPRANQSISTIKYLNQAQQPVKCTKIFIKKAGDSSDKNTVYLGEIGEVGTSKAKPKIQHIPATKHSQFY